MIEQWLATAVPFGTETIHLIVTSRPPPEFLRPIGNEVTVHGDETVKTWVHFSDVGVGTPEIWVQGGTSSYVPPAEQVFVFSVPDHPASKAAIDLRHGYPQRIMLTSRLEYARSGIWHRRRSA